MPDDHEDSILDIPPAERRLHTEINDFTVFSLHQMLNSGSIYIPLFQRQYVWTRTQASRLIESLLIQCPIPVIYLNQERDEALSVIDGNQRLQSIKLFIEDGFQLKGLTAYPELEDTLYSDLDPRFQRHILNRTLRCIVILKDTHPRIKFDVFERLNTGAVQLNPQEIRHGVYHGSLMELVDKLTKEHEWIRLSGLKSDTRMKGAELVVRFMALCQGYESYKKPLTAFLNDFCDRNQNASDSELANWSDLFRATLSMVSAVLGSHAFRIFDDGGHPNKSMNAALFDAQMVGIARFIRRGNHPVKQPIPVRSLMDLYNEEEFKTAITSGTSSSNLVKYRIERFIEFLNVCGG